MWKPITTIEPIVFWKNKDTDLLFLTKTEPSVEKQSEWKRYRAWISIALTLT